jgi:carboxyl-terminal processing protease
MEKIDRPPEAANRRKIPLTVLWVVSTIVFCAVFAITLAPRAKAQARGEQNSISQYTSIFRNVFDLIQNRYIEETDPDMLFEGAMTGMINSLGDPYSAFLPEREMRDTNDLTQGSFGGIGLYVSKPGNYLEVSSPIEDTPGWRAGIKAGDLIILIDGESTDALTSDEAVDRLRGKPGTAVNLLIRRGEKLEFPVTLVRAEIEVPTVKYAMIGDIGYLNLLTFSPMTIDRSRDAIGVFASNNYKSIILDLRNNYGGLLNSAIDVCNLFSESGIVVSTKSRIASENMVFRARRGGAMVGANIPVVVLINRGSASASEIVAGALKDWGRAYLVGERSYGKGSVQQVYPLDKVGFKITTARYYTPSDVNIDKIGIPPDREVSFPALSDQDAVKLNNMINSGKVSDFVIGNPNANAETINAFLNSLSSEFDLDIPLLRRYVREEQNRRSLAPAYDLEIDVQLNEAVKILREENFRALMQTSKTLKTLQEEAMEDDELRLAS